MNNKQAIGVAVVIGIVAVVALASRTEAATEPIYYCPIDGLVFATQEELIAHYLEEHPGQRVPITIIWS